MKSYLFFGLQTLRSYYVTFMYHLYNNSPNLIRELAPRLIPEIKEMIKSL